MSNFDQFFGNLRRTSEWKLNTNADVASSANTYETVYSFTGAGSLDSITIAATAADRIRAIVEVTIDGGTLYELDMGTHMASNTGTLWGTDIASATSALIPINQDFKTSILVRAKNDTSTGAVAVSVSSSEDQ